jgi:hypothetical protein
VTAASEAALKTAAEAVMAGIRNCSGKNIVYEETSGTTLVEMLASDWPMAEAEIVHDYEGLQCFIAFQLFGKTPVNTGGGGGGGTPTGALEGVEWQYQLAGNHLAGMVGEGLFGPTTAGGGATALQNAQAWYSGLVSGSGRPAFAPSQLTDVDAVFVPVQVQNQSDVFNPVRCVVMFREKPSAIASSWPDMVKDCAVSVQSLERRIKNYGGGIASDGKASTQLAIVGQFTIVTEGNTTFLSSLTKVAPGAIYDKAFQAVQAIVTWFKQVYRSEFSNFYNDDNPAEIDIKLDEGVVTFTKIFETDRIISWNETIVKRFHYPKTFSRDAEGKEWEYAPKGGAVATIEHELEIVKVGSPAAYRAPIPGSNKNWSRLDALREPVFGMEPREGTIEYTTRGGGVWRYVNKQSKGPGEGITTAGGQLNGGNLATADI